MAVVEFTPEELAAEEWRPVLDKPAYQISSLGRFMRADGIVITGAYESSPYAVVSTGRTRAVHALVAAAFLGPRRKGYCVNHKDGVKTNNRVTNIEYVTPRENSRHAVAMGLSPTGDRNGSRKHPESLKRGDQHWARIHPEWVLRGDKSGPRLHPERMARGDRHGSRTKPERTRRGEEHGRAKLGDAQVLEIRARLATGERQVSLGGEFGVSQTVISKIKLRKLWGHI